MTFTLIQEEITVMSKTFLFKRGHYYHLEYNDFEGRLRRITTKCTKKNDALAFVLKFEQEQKAAPKVKNLVLSSVIREYENFLETNYSKGYYEAVKIHLRHFKEFIGDISINTIRINDIELFISDIFKVSKVNAKRHLITIKTFLNKAVTWGYLLNNPSTNIKLPKLPSIAPIFITEQELNDILSKETNKDLHDIYFVLAHTGMRLNELTNLKWCNISLTDRLINITNSDTFTTKSKKDRTIPMHDMLFNVISKRVPKIINLTDSNYVFLMHGRQFNGDYISKSFKKIVRSCKNINQEVHLHSLRHFFASQLVKKNVSLVHVKELLGHRDFSTSLIYSHLTVDNLREAVKVLEG